MTSTTNDQRAKRFARTLRGYGTDHTERGCLIDLLADARHWCDRTGACFDGIDRVAHDRYLADLCDDRRPS